MTAGRGAASDNTSSLSLLVDFAKRSRKRRRWWLGVQRRRSSFLVGSEGLPQFEGGCVSSCLFSCHFKPPEAGNPSEKTATSYAARSTSRNPSFLRDYPIVSSTKTQRRTSSERVSRVSSKPSRTSLSLSCCRTKESQVRFDFRSLSRSGRNPPFVNTRDFFPSTPKTSCCRRTEMDASSRLTSFFSPFSSATVLSSPLRPGYILRSHDLTTEISLLRGGMKRTRSSLWSQK